MVGNIAALDERVKRTFYTCCAHSAGVSSTIVVPASTSHCTLLCERSLQHNTCGSTGQVCTAVLLCRIMHHSAVTALCNTECIYVYMRLRTLSNTEYIQPGCFESTGRWMDVHLIWIESPL